MDFEKYQNLHTIIMLKDVIRKWWHSELQFADREGTVTDWAKGEIVPPPNDFCRLSLFSKEGFRRCNQSVRVLHEKFRSSKKLRGALFHDCHQGFTVVGAPIYLDNEYQGFLFVEGFLRQAINERDAESLKGKIKELNAGATDLDRAVERIPLMTPTEVDKLTDLLEFGATEIANYESEVAKKDEAVVSLSPELNQAYTFENFVGKSDAMLELIRLMEKVCNSDSSVLIQGEPGTGKELLARTIHYNGPRKDRPFAAQSCSAFDETLLESTLFGHGKGSFAGALRDRKGLVESVEGGTLFLDEIGTLTPSLQVKLLRMLQDGVYTPLGSTQPREANVRIIAATPRALEDQVKAGAFREDLFYRINIIRAELPPLRDRAEDVPLLVDYFLRKYHREGQRSRGFTPDALSVLCSYPWPGNIRELENELERLLVLAGDQELIPLELLSLRVREGASLVQGGQGVSSRAIGRLSEAVEILEREMIQHGLLRTGNNKSRLARELGISRSNLILKIAKYGFERGPEADDEATA